MRQPTNGKPIRARPVGPLGRASRWCRRRPVAAGAVMLLSLVTLFAGREAWLRHAREVEIGQLKRALSDDFERVTAPGNRSPAGASAAKSDTALARAVSFIEHFTSDPGARAELAKAWFIKAHTLFDRGQTTAAEQAYGKA